MIERLYLCLHVFIILKLKCGEEIFSDSIKAIQEEFFDSTTGIYTLDCGVPKPRT